MNFQIGDVVELKSGGPNMTVNFIKSDEIWVSWFDADAKPQKHYFHPAMLQKVAAVRAA